ncbi:MAG: hypothetical protein PVI26_00180 [Chitinispirillia bacterium]|jgi:hypothetical protein
MAFEINFNTKFLLLLQIFDVVKLAGLAIVIYCTNSLADDYTLKSVIIPEVPSINKEKNIIYKLDLLFDKCPPDYWINYNKGKEKLIIDFYGINIAGDPEIKLSESGVYKKIAIENSETKLSLTGKGSKIFITINSDQGWHFKASSINATTIRINAWKDISNLSIVEQKKKPVRFYIVIGSILFLISVGAILLLFIE